MLTPDTVYNNSVEQIFIPESATQALSILESAGFEAWVVGGYVRDALLDKQGTDIDIATSARWQEAQHLFEENGYRTRETGVAHGTITVLIENSSFEVTTYRHDGTYLDARHPQEVTFVRSIEEDLARRDFTINALAYHPQRGILDCFGGMHDLQTKTLRTVGNSAKRFSEDALRILRGCRFVSQLGFSLEEETMYQMLSHKYLLSRISAERITHELELLLLGEYVKKSLLETVDILAAVMPELVACKDFDQRTPYHRYDVLEHTAITVNETPSYPLVRWSALFHDLGKPASFFIDKKDIGHFYGHAAISIHLARSIMARLRLAPSFCTKVCTLVELHDETIEPTSKGVKRMLARLGGDVELFNALCDLKQADAAAQAPQCAYRIGAIEELKCILNNILKADEAFSLNKLAINGNQVMELGIPAGPEVGQVLRAALNAVIDEAIPNEYKALNNFVKTWSKGNSAPTDKADEPNNQLKTIP